MNGSPSFLWDGCILPDDRAWLKQSSKLNGYRSGGYWSPVAEDADWKGPINVSEKSRKVNRRRSLKDGKRLERSDLKPSLIMVVTFLKTARENSAKHGILR
jgi:hypothetical protein